MDYCKNWKNIQAKLAKRVNIPTYDTVMTKLACECPYILGFDISYNKHNKHHAICTVVLLQWNDIDTVIDSETHKVSIIYPYQAGFLAFRELDPYLLVFQRLMTRHLDKIEQIGCCVLDGNGILHPFKCGLATHFGIYTGYPTIGAAKNLHHIDGLDRKEIRFYMDQNHINEYLLSGDSGTVYGYALRINKSPIYISVGHNISLNSCLLIARRLMKYRELEPTRLADRISREYLRQ